ncbi:MAG: SGNH/GDSL hydrolase family protein [Bradyrhizobium sp.]|uniref:SGNH/GDSL hydrolase family protein n=1 Tax=Bradyrhizobium sp. TaxID=376 RepID=UPI00120C6258|nr:SGNH/GDSL hydrolase family protein [Bradyrhizobium sp.]THD64939.1 MAG: SGNH/GDSL hydrolase family protein [Bradyrhizobium sp.]
MSETTNDLVRFKYPLPHLAKSLKSRRKVKIVAIGSSSTAGEGKILPYPGRLEMVLRSRFHDRMIDVVNRGVSGQEATDELSRFDPDVIDEAPALVIWQVGTNAVFRNQDYNPDDVIASIVTGLERLSSLPMDVVLMDLQYTTAIVGTDKLKLSEQMVARIADAAGKANVNVFRRFALMRRWVDDCIPIENLIDPADGSQLHMSDWCTGCIAQVLDIAMASAPVA